MPLKVGVTFRAGQPGAWEQGAVVAKEFEIPVALWHVALSWLMGSPLRGPRGAPCRLGLCCSPHPAVRERGLRLRERLTI